MSEARPPIRRASPAQAVGNSSAHVLSKRVARFALPRPTRSEHQNERMRPLQARSMDRVLELTGIGARAWPRPTCYPDPLPGRHLRCGASRGVLLGLVLPRNVLQQEFRQHPSHSTHGPSVHFLTAICRYPLASAYSERLAVPARGLLGSP